MHLIGTRIGNFVLKRLLGTGGMGQVFYAEHASIPDEARVFKILLPHLTDNEEITGRFFNEARAAAAIKHRNIMRARDFGRVAGSMYIEMEWFDGETLSNILASRGPMPPSRVIAIISGVAAGIQAAHARGIIHRDLKPDNVFVAKIDGLTDVAKVLDFGVAKLQGDFAAGMQTRTGELVGTPAYAAPEQLETTATITPRVDVYALGVITYEMLTGFLPFQKEPTREAFFSLSAFQIYNRLANERPIDPRERDPNIPPAMAAVILRALSRDPAQRFEDSRAFALALADSAGPEAVKIVRRHAPDLVDDANMLETVRSPGAQRGAGTALRYTFDRKLGEGGMAEVYVGRQTGAEGFSKPVAIKRILAHFSALPKFAEMFISEAKLASKLDHRNIVSVLHFDRDTVGRLFLVMEFVDGKDLRALVKSGALPPSVALYVITEMLRGLELAHVNLVLHRDISPHNVLLSWAGDVKVSDFGIAKALDASGSGQSLVVKGKPGYMSPEQIRADRLDGRSDLYAVGIVLWELVTGRRLFTGGPNEAFDAILHRPPPRPSTSRPVPPDLEAVIMKFLERDPALRYPSAAHAIQDLTRCNDFPRDGARALAILLAERFPNDAPRSLPSVELARSEASGPTSSAPPQRPSNLATTIPDPMPAIAYPAQMLAVPIENIPKPAATSTLGGAASQSLSPVPPAARRARWPVIAATATVAVAGAAIAFVVSRASARTSVNAALAAGSADASGAIARPSSSAPRDAAPTVAITSRPSPPVPAAPPDAASEQKTAAPDASVAIRASLDARVAAAPVAHARTEPSSANEHLAHLHAIAPAATGELEVTAAPWAVVYVDGKLGKQTPQRLTIPVGRHELLLVHGTKKKTMAVTITKDKPVVIHEETGSW